ncbi:hypothetical protein C9F11_37620 [Streptomyces sp. YIM 121038]|nr:hypothetical protein C9F11_37620 [Streptomyces sp. YIM 121038]
MRAFRFLRQVVAPDGRHRRPHGAAAHTAFRFCLTCGIEAVAVVHADGSHTCAEGHTTAKGGSWA